MHRRAVPSYKPYVPADTDMKEFTMRALIIGLIMSVSLGAANAYLGLKAGMTIATTYPAAVIGMALFLMKGSILETSPVPWDQLVSRLRLLSNLYRPEIHRWNLDELSPIARHFF